MISKSESLIEAYRWTTEPWRWLQRWQRRRSARFPIVVLFYHRVADTDATDWTISRAGFAAQLDWLQQHFELLSMDQVHERLRTGYNDRPAVAITFDDGYAENMDFALPLLAEREIPCMYYVSTSFVLNQAGFPHDIELGLQLHPNSVSDLKQIVKWGLDVGAHTRTHADLGKIADSPRLREELIGCRRELVNLLNVPVDHFAFPYGQTSNITPEAIEVARQAGYRTVAAAYGGYNHIGMDPFFIQRIHGDPTLTRIKNWTTLDPRWMATRPDPQWLDGAVQHATPSTRPVMGPPAGMESASAAPDVPLPNMGKPSLQIPSAIPQVVFDDDSRRNIADSPLVSER